MKPRRILLVLLCLCLLSAMGFASVFAFATELSVVDSGTCGDNLTWQLDSNGTLTIGGTGAITSYDDSSSVPWYSHSSDIKSVVISEGVTSIGTFAFSGCTNVDDVTVPKSVKSISSEAFNGDVNKTVHYNGTLEDWLKIAVTYRPAISSSSNNSLTYGATLYINGELLTDLNIPNGTKSFNASMFYGCSSLLTISIPESVTTVDGSFGSCAMLQAVYYKSDLDHWLGISFNGNESSPVMTGRPVYINDTPISEITEVTIPEGTTTINNGTFSGWTNLKKVTIPDTVTKIGDEAFNYCTGLTDITLPEGLEYIGDNGFYMCSGLTEIPDNISHIGDCGLAFTGISKAVLPEGTTEIATAAFACCENLTEITIPSTVTKIGTEAFHGAKNLKKVTLPSGVTDLGDWKAFGYCAITHITIPAGVKDLDGSPLFQCPYLKTIIFEGDLPTFYCPEYTNYVCAYYPDGNETWTEEGLASFKGEMLTWNAWVTLGDDPDCEHENVTGKYVAANSETGAGSYTLFECECGFSYKSANTEETAGNNEECTHENMTPTVVATDCTTAGYTKYTCPDCGFSYKTNVASGPLGHCTEHDYSEDVYATCISTGISGTDSCRRCDYTEGPTVTEIITWHSEYELINEGRGIAHEANYTVCGGGYKYAYFECKLCHKYFNEFGNEAEYTAATEKHTLKEVLAKEATKSEDGNIYHWHCSVCGSNFSDSEAATLLDNVVLPKLLEVEVETLAEVPESIKQQYETVTDVEEALTDAALDEDEDIAPATATTVFVDVKLVLRDPNNGTTTPVTPETFPEEGVDAWLDYPEGTDETFTFVVTHMITSGANAGTIEVLDNTPEEKGIKVHFSSMSPVGITYETHDLIEHLRKDSSCTAEGNIHYYSCKDCDKLFSDAGAENEITDKNSVVIAKKAHVLTKHDRNEASCTADGNILYYSCSECLKNFSDEQCTQTVENIVITKKGHDYETAWTTDSTQHWHKCKNCTATTEKINHTMVEKIDVQASCTKEGSKHQECECGYKTASETVNILAHEYDTAWQNDVTGHWHKCKNCTATTEKADHEIEKVKAAASTCKKQGNIEHYACKLCGAKFADEQGKEALTDAQVLLDLADHSIEKEWSYSSTKHFHKCSVCEKKFDEADHSFGEWKTSNGKKTRTCSVCGYVQTGKVEEPVTPKTDDDSSIAIYAAAIVLSAAVCAVLMCKKKKEQ